MHRIVLGSLLAAAASAAALASGQPDPSFGADGAVILHADYAQPVGREYANDMLIDHAGRYVTVGAAFQTNDSDAKIALVTRNLASGAPDTSLGGSGFMHPEWQGEPLSFSYVQETDDNKLLVAGRRDGSDALADFPLVCRLGEDGQFDPGFGTGGCRTLDVVHGGPGLNAWSILGMQVQADGRILVLGNAPLEIPDDPRGFALVRLLPDGDDDLDFGDSSACPNPAPRCGIAYSPASLGDAIRAGGLALDPQGRSVVGAHMNVGTFQLITAFRYAADGDLDLVFEAMNFDSLTGSPDTTHTTGSVQAAPDGSVLVTGTLHFEGKSRVAVARLRADGTHDPLFGVQGRAYYAFDASDDYNQPRETYLQSDDKLLVAGYSGPQPWRCQVLRIDGMTGALDAAFGQDGVATPATLNALSPADCHVSAVVSDGRNVLVAGTSDSNDSDTNPFLLRLDQDDLFGDGLED